jgi:O-acetyl-ADP-ribose deacetylase (regulator of RNase III)
MNVSIVTGDLLKQDCEVIVNSWNRNLFPWWLLLPQGVSAAIKREGGYGPFKALRKYGLLKLGEAVETGAGNLKFKSIIHVAGINLLWFATEFSVRESVKNAMNIVNEKKYCSAAFPLIGSGSGNRSKEKCLNWMLDAFESIESSAKVIVVKFEKSSQEAAREQ